MTLKKTELYRGFNIFTEEIRAGGWRVALVEVPASDGVMRDVMRDVFDYVDF